MRVHPGTTSSYDSTSASSPISWTHTLTVGSTGLLVWALSTDQAEAAISAHIGGIPLEKLVEAETPTGGNDSCTVTCFGIGGYMPSGTHTITVAWPSGTFGIKTGLATNYYGEVPAFLVKKGSLSTTAQNPTGVMSFAGSAQIVQGWFSGRADVSGMTPLAGWSSDEEVDGGNWVFGLYSKNAEVSNSAVIGATTNAIDEWVSIAIAVRPRTHLHLVPSSGDDLPGEPDEPGGPVVAEPPAGALTFTGFAPTVLTPRLIDVPIGAMTLAGLVPVPLISIIIDVPVGSISFAGLAPSVEQDVVENVPVGSISLTGLVPTVLNPAGAVVPVGSMSLTGLAPDITNPAGAEIPVGSITLAGLTPTILNPAGAEVPAGALTLTGLVPDVIAVGDVAVDVPVGAIVITGLVPSVSTGLFLVEHIEHNPAGDIVTGLDSGRSYKIVGNQFGAVQGTVVIDGVSQTITSWNDTEIIITAVQGAESMGAAVMTVEKNA